MWNTVLFDLDGTLTDSQLGITKSVSRALAHFGIQAEPKDLVKFIGPPLSESLPEFYGFGPEQTEEGIRVFREYFESRGWQENAPYPGIAALLGDLKAAGLRLLVATSKPENQAVRILEYFQLAQYFDKICGAPVSRGDGTRKAEVIRSALRWAEITDLSAAVMVGDRRHDVAGAHEMGLSCIGVLYGYGGREELEQAGAEFIAEDMDGLRRLLGL